MRIAQAEGKIWKEEVRKYLIAYRSTAHTTTGVSPAELLIGRKRPKLREEMIAGEVRDRDSEMIAKAKVYADKIRNAKHSDLSQGHKVLVKPEIHEVDTKTGNCVDI